MKKIISIFVLLCAAISLPAQTQEEQLAGIRSAVNRGDEAAMYQLGWCYEFGRQGLVTPDFSKAFDLYKRSADKNFAPAQCRLGLCYEMGIEGILTPDPYEAVEWYRKSAEQGYAEAQLYLGNGYMSGYAPLTQSETEAIRWWEKSANQGLPQAQIALMNHYLQKENYNRAICWAEKIIAATEVEKKNVPAEQLAEFDRQLSTLKNQIRQLKDAGYSCSGSNRQIETPKVEEAKATYVRTNISEKNFDSKGGTQDITVNSDGKSYNVKSNSPDWCSIEAKSGFFTVTCKQNYDAYRSATLTVTADNKTATVLIEQSEAVATYIRSNPNSAQIGALSGKTEISILTDGYTWSYSDVPPWLTASKSKKTLILTAQSNSGSDRNDNITVSSGNYSASINIFQPQQATYIKAGKSSIRFSTGGNSETVSVETDGEDWTYANMPSWITAKKNGNYLTLRCDENTGQYSGKRETSFTVISDNKTATVSISQPAPFNAPKGDPRPLGLSVGYVQKQWKWKTDEGEAKYGAWDKAGTYLDGIQAGVRVEPLFKYGFGLSTGLFYGYYFSKSDKQIGTYNDAPGTFDYNMTFSEHLLCLPLHLEYHANISENFLFFVEAGPSIDYGLSAKLTATEVGENTPFYTETDIYRNSEIGFPNKRLNVSLDFGTGIRLSELQLNVGMSRGLMNTSSNPNINIKQNKNLMASLSWMIPYDKTNYDKNYNTIPVNSIDKSKYHIHGIILEYISKQWEYKNGTYTEKSGLWEDSRSVPGFRLGYVYQPQFIYGFGLKTGLNIDTYISVSDDMYSDYGSYYELFSEMAFNVPIHAEYRLHLPNKISLFVETGISFDLGLFAEMKSHGDGESYTESNLYGKADWGYPSERFNVYWDTNGGIRIKNLQFQIGASRGLNEISIDDNWKVRQNKKLSLGISWMFF
ncbi:MAG: outer membrane beta-barrel protein [Prevotellaceae bacterium]|jgi:hypothetical protein|nr:outer membrane beta-barrel protein [Prevotellaceae bacterium]